MDMIEFQPFKGSPELRPGLAYRTHDDALSSLRITHVFPGCIYFMHISSASDVRYAKRPKRLSRAQFWKLVEDNKRTGCFGTLNLPESLSWQPSEDSERFQAIQHRWAIIEPLVEHFESQRHLERDQFTLAIQQRAAQQRESFDTVKRTLLRYYYFGQNKLALIPLPPGTKPGTKAMPEDWDASRQVVRSKRVGAKPRKEEGCAASDFVMNAKDARRMQEAYRSMLKKGPVTVLRAYYHYMSKIFSIDHPKIYEDFVDERIQPPVTERMFRFHISKIDLSEEEEKNSKRFRNRNVTTGALIAVGPGEVYEADATGARIFLVSETDDPNVFMHVGKPIIYLVVDRWSRFITGAHLTLGTNSYEELRHALLFTFGPRTERFRRLGIEVDESEWPRAQICSTLLTDRGSDFLSANAAAALADELKMEHQVLRARCPNGKSIVEKLNRTIKASMSGLRGAFHDRPLDLRTKQAAKAAECDAISTVEETFSELINLINEYNNKPHRTLRKRASLRRSGVAPTPKAAYLWGLRNISGLRKSPVGDMEMEKMLLPIKKATMSKGLLRFEGNTYEPIDALAIEKSKATFGVSRSYDIKIDPIIKMDAWVQIDKHRKAHFRATPETQEKLGNMLPSEQEAMKCDEDARNAKINNNEIRRAVRSVAERKAPSKRERHIASVDGDTKRELRYQANLRMKEQISGVAKPCNHRPTPQAQQRHTDAGQDTVTSSWRSREDSKIKSFYDRLNDSE